MSKKSNFSFIPIIILILIIVHLVRLNKGHINDWLNQSKLNIEQKHKMNPETFRKLIEKLKEDKIKDRNYEPMKPVNPHK